MVDFGVQPVLDYGWFDYFFTKNFVVKNLAIREDDL
jgi:hypothetical protein